ncbi:lipoyl(octanoyl) transferase LipB [Algicola sagamiensis]|uniref:lipoyl(octanoyl) transferase LipB n=1 Tax=Algicola sagamiensis TaxID=163869 RepID=UPI00035FE68E|nr:lipoyl(octanoyl) transferase LipB [Algicola sagamiensis]
MSGHEQLILRQLGRQPYQPIWQAMQSFTDNRDDATKDELWILQHEPVFTQGQGGKAEHLLAPGDIPVVKVDRGGQVTYHGPGQLVIYLLINLRRRQLGVRQLVTLIEESIVATLAQFQINSYPKPDAPGVYVDDKKIASLGLRVRKGCSFHGLALNIDMDLEPFLRINPCGYAGLEMVQLSQLSQQAGFDDVATALGTQIAERLDATDIIYKTGFTENND